MWFRDIKSILFLFSNASTHRYWFLLGWIRFWTCSPSQNFKYKNNKWNQTHISLLSQMSAAFTTLSWNAPCCYIYSYFTMIDQYMGIVWIADLNLNFDLTVAGLRCSEAFFSITLCHAEDAWEVLNSYSIYLQSLFVCLPKWHWLASHCQGFYVKIDVPRCCKYSPLFLFYTHSGSI